MVNALGAVTDPIKFYTPTAENSKRAESMPESDNPGRAVGALNPCPFCGGPSRVEAVAAWNLRAGLDAEAVADGLRAENVQLAELLIAARDEIAALIDRLAEMPTD